MTKLMLPKHLPALEKLEKQSAEAGTWLDPLAIYTLNELIRVPKKVIGCVETDLKRYGLSRGRYTTLWVIREAGPNGITPAEIADELDVTRATMTGLLDGMERDRLVMRVRSEDDRRKVIVKISRQGVKVLNQLAPNHYEKVAEALSGLTEKEKKTLLDLLHRIETGAEVFLRDGEEKPDGTGSSAAA